jgi:hypothetical protein
MAHISFLEIDYVQMLLSVVYVHQAILKRSCFLLDVLKSGLDPPTPLVLDMLGVTFVQADLRKNILPKNTSKLPKNTSHLLQKPPNNF